ncbi:hypothetical protein [Sphingomonas hengshuiensis]|uniref:hypothetical protein n=1 Tax=Sphingomonas hengshuiensis TaxID=1609977 RepID=UPI0005C96B80|nr:hypothetical protein [Sphingomonas hengshuiensis]
MKSDIHQDPAQAMQRVRVGMTGLVLVLVLIGFASAMYSSANRDEPVSAVGASNADIVANLSDAPARKTVSREKDEPLAELGVAPSVGSTDTPVGGGDSTGR